MKIRNYRTEDAPYICGWITDETAFYEWSAGVLGEYPITAEAFDAKTQSALAAGRYVALTYADDNDRPAGHIIIRYPDAQDDTLIRFGFVIIDPELRGRGLGHELLDAACEFAKNELKAGKATLAVFTRNVNALHCYNAAGFVQTGDTEMYRVPLGEWECVVLERKL